MADLVSRLLVPVSLNEESVKQSGTGNQIGGSYVADIQWSSKHVSLHCTDVEEHKHLKNHFNEQLNINRFNTFKDLFSDVNVDSIQETYSKFSIYNKIIIQYVEETNIKHGLNLKFTKLEAPEVGLWAKTFQVAGHDEDQQLPKQLVSPWLSEPSQSQSHQPPQQQAHHMPLLTDELPLTKQWAETDWLNSVATQWSLSTTMLLLVTQEDNRQYMHQAGQNQHNIGYVSPPELYPPQVTGNGRFS